MLSPGNGLYQYVLLLWKNWLFRKRHYIVTALEILFPILLASIPLIIHFKNAEHKSHYDNRIQSISENKYKNTTYYQPFNPLSKANNYRRAYVFYTPDFVISKKVIDSAVMKLWPNMEEHKINITALTNEKDLENAALEIQFGDTLKYYDYVILGIVFNNFHENGSKFPTSLDYKLRYLDYSERDFYTNRKFGFQFRGPRSYDDYVQSLFLGVQSAIDMSFISLVNNSKNLKVKDIKVDLQRFPYPPYNSEENNFTVIQLSSMMIAYGFIIFAIVLVKRVVDEKVNGSKELMRMMGMSDFTYWSSTFLSYFILAFIIYLIIAILYKIPFLGPTSCLENSDFFLFLILLLLYGASSILFCLAVTTFINRAVFAVVAIIILWSVTHDLVFAFYFPFGETDAFYELGLGAKLGLCLLPNSGIKMAIQIVSKMIKDGKGSLWSNMTEFALTPDLNLAMVMAMMFTSCILYSIIIWYVDAVWPWKLGVPKPFYFPFTKEYWCGSKPQQFEEQDNTSLQSMEYFEDDPINRTPGVVISHLTKEFTTGLRTKTAVNDVSLKIYNGQITALLGHNGAGKTTTINILTGMYPPTSGTASINGFDILSSTKKARGSMGLCPQHNVLYDSLTIEEHLMLYAGLKGVIWSRLRPEALKIIKLLGLELKQKELAKTLSGGMKRKLSLGIAVVGGSKVLFLDEPTSGLDVEARRSVWDMLLSIRNDRTIILTTHYMEEADVLGDRIAIMADGEIECCGSPFFLKMKFGTGYHLHVTIEPKCDMNHLTTLLQKHIPEAKLKAVLGNEATFALSGNTSSSFGNMFQELENNKEKIGIGSFGITVTTMEDVFLNVGSIVDKLKLSNASDNQEISSYHSTSSNELVPKYKLQGVPKLLQQMKGLFVKRAEYAKRHWNILSAQIIIPLSIMCIFCWLVFNIASLSIAKEPLLQLDLKSVFGYSNGFYHFTKEQEAEVFASGYLKDTLLNSGVAAQKVNDSNEFLINIGKNNLQEFLKKIFVGGSAHYIENGTLYLKAWYNGEPYHISAMSLNIMNTAVLKYLTDTSSAVIRTANVPFPRKSTYMRTDFDSQSEKMLTSIFIPLSLVFLSASFVLVPVHETITKAKLLQLMTGISGITYWIMMFAFDALIYILCCIILLVPFAIFDSSNIVVGHPEAIGTFFLLFILYGLCSIPLCYLVSFLVKKPSTGFSLLIAFNFITGLVITVIMVSIGFNMYDDEQSKKVAIALWFLRLLPSFAVSWGSTNVMGIAFGNVLCDNIPSNVKEYMCETLTKTNKLFVCCEDKCADKCFKKIHPITWERIGCGKEIFFLLLDTVIFFGIIFILESPIKKHLQKLFKRLLSSLSVGRKAVFMQPTTSLFTDSDVCNENQRVENIFHQGRAKEEALLTLGLTKWFHSVCAVDHLTFAVHNEECFGLLGVNGAGKTTTFKMLTGDISPTEGTAVIQDSSLYENLKMFQSYIGYCPQYDALIDRLTGRELLTLFSRLRCLPEKDVQFSVKQMIEMVNLEEHADKQTRYYSGGNKRKLSLALALIGSPPVILLDEPTSGVDPVARRKIWNSLCEAKIKTGAAIILTTHSMEECEALCSRLAIMVNGQFRCIGPIRQLKSKFGQGYTLIVKLQQQQFLDANAMVSIKSHIEKDFPSASLKDDHQGMLQYHISDASIPWSHLFNVMEQVKKIYQLEDYLISDTSLEQIFLTFARAQRISGNIYI